MRRKSSKFAGVYIDELQDGDKTYYITFKDADGKKIWMKIGKYSEGIREQFCNGKGYAKSPWIWVNKNPISNLLSKITNKLEVLVCGIYLIFVDWFRLIGGSKRGTRTLIMHFFDKP